MTLLPTPDIIRVNSAVYSWNSTASYIDNMPYIGIVGVDFDHGIESEKVWAQTRAGAPIGRTDGKYDANLKISMLRQSWVKTLLPQLRAKGALMGGVGVMRVPFSYQLQYTHLLIGTHTIDFVDCRIAKHTEPNQQGTAPLQTDLEISVMDILLDGASMHAAGLLAVAL